MHKNDWFKSDAGWECDREGGCECGAGMIKQDELCYADIYEAKSGTNDTQCNAETCSAYCRNNNCVCGKNISWIEKIHKCKLEERICVNPFGCMYDNHYYSLYQTMFAFSVVLQLFSITSHIGEWMGRSIVCNKHNDLLIFRCRTIQNMQIHIE